MAPDPETQQELRDDFEFADVDHDGYIGFGESLDVFVTWWTQD